MKTCNLSSQRLTGGLSEGVEILTLDNGVLALDVCPTRGLGLLSARCGDVVLGWASPVRRPVHPAFIELGEYGGTGWLRGFSEWLVRCGLHSMVAPCEDAIRGATGGLRRVALPLHGTIANLPADLVQASSDPATGDLLLSGEVHDTGLFQPSLHLRSTLRLPPGQPAFSLHDTIYNPGDLPAEYQLLYHINFGPPLLQDGSRLRARWASIEPRDDHTRAASETHDHFGPPLPGRPEDCFFCRLESDPDGLARVLLHNAAADRGCLLAWTSAALPCFTIWKNTAGLHDGYVVGLEPGTAFPNPKPMERAAGRVATLSPGGSFSLELHTEVLPSASAVHDALARYRLA